MRTNDLIELLAKDASPPWRFGSLVAVAVIGGSVLAALVFAVAIGVRPDIAAASHTVRFLFKFVVTVALAVVATRAVLGLGRPDGRLAEVGPGLALPAMLLAAAGAVELLVLPDTKWLPSLVGHNAPFCLTLIPMLSIGPLACFLVALRQGAPSRPGLAGAVAGIAAAGIAATFYASHCDDDSPIFVMVWYSLAVLIVTGAGFFAGRTLLRW